MKLGTRAMLTIGAALVIAAATILWFVNAQMRRQALDEAEQKALLLLNYNLAVHTYFSHQLKPKVFQVIENAAPAGYFEPAWMSSTFAVRGIDGYSKALSQADYYYKEAAINARMPQNEAEDYEINFLDRLNADAALTVESSVRKINGKYFYVVLRRGESMMGDCLRCHSRPQAAPADMVKIYGPQRSFGRQEGEVVSAISLRIPLDSAYAQANRLTLILAVVIVITLAVAGLVIHYLNRRLFYLPLQTIQEQTSLIAQGGERLGAQLPLNFPGEWNDLATHFNRMSTSLRAIYDSLEDKVRQRTQDLEQALAEVKQLSGLLPICAHCKKIRDDKGYWKQIEDYVSIHSEATFSHGICPECIKKLYPECDLPDEYEDSTGPADEK
ncbi:hypothetical protein AAU61_11500 [Desulfocarbo indianensis]|nr:hypothetical protein AAU61_11500 [Desulfocarbo indianensis]